MSAHSDTHGHGAPGGEHVPHVLPLKVYLGVFAMLLVFTGLTYAVSYVDLGRTVNLVVALAVAACKASMVGLIFMHLAFDKKFNGLIFLSSILFLVVLIGLTMEDTERRGKAGGHMFVEGDKPANVASPFEKDGTKRAKALIETWTPKADEPKGEAPPAHH